MIQLAEYAAAVGAETFLLDLKWCVHTGLDPFADQDAHGDADPPRDRRTARRIRQFDLQVLLAYWSARSVSDRP